MRKLVYALLFISTLNSCYYDVEEDLYPGFCNSVEVSYSRDIVPFIELRCATPGCHIPGGTGNGDLTTYEGVKAKVDNGSLVRRVLEIGDMPGVGDLTECELDKLRSWIDDGAENN